jgi:hypothetical protein
VCRWLCSNLTHTALGISPGVVLLELYSRFIFSFLKNLHIVFHSGCINLHSHLQCMRVPFSPHTHQNLLLLFLMVAILTRGRSNVSVILVCISFMARDLSIFMCSLDTWNSSFEKVLFNSVAHSFIGSLLF